MKSALTLAREAVDLAAKATNGEWKLDGKTVRVHSRGVIAVVPSPQATGVFECSDNAKFIAHAGTSYATVARAAIEMAAIVEQLRPRGHELLCASARLGPGRGPCDCGYVALCARIDALTKDAG